MEIHRLKPMKEGYDQELFYKIYKETENLRNKLTYEIDSRRYGVTPDIIKSWFDDKFIFVFNKYHKTMDDNRLKGFIINSLKTFKYRILRKAYSENNININQVYLEGEHSLINVIPDKSELSDNDLFLELALKFLKKNLSDEAFELMRVELNPPPYILTRMVNPKTKIPAKLLAEYLGMKDMPGDIKYVNNLRKEINSQIENAKEYFSIP